MKKVIYYTLAILLLTQSVHADQPDWLECAVEEMNAPHTTCGGCEDPIFKGVASSMLAWGVGLFVGIALLTGLVYNSPAPPPPPTTKDTN